MVNYRRNVAYVALVLLIWDAAGFVFPSLLIHQHIEQQKATHGGMLLERYDPPTDALALMIVLGISMGYDFSLMMSCILKSPRMLMTWVLGAPVRGIAALITGVWEFAVMQHGFLLIALLTGAYFTITCIIVAVGIIVSIPYWAALATSQEAQELRERRRQAGDIERLREAATAATLSRRQERLQAQGSSSSASAASDDGGNTMYARSTPEVHSYAYRHQRDRTYYAPKIAY